MVNINGVIRHVRWRALLIWPCVLVKNALERYEDVDPSFTGKAPHHRDCLLTLHWYFRYTPASGV